MPLGMMPRAVTVNLEMRLDNVGCARVGLRLAMRSLGDSAGDWLMA